MWPDRADAALEIIEKGGVSYIAFDTMAEMTLPGLQKQRLDNPGKGYTDVRRASAEILPACLRHGVKMITNAGGANPEAAWHIALEQARLRGLKGARIAVITGDDTVGEATLRRVRELQAKGASLAHADTGAPLESVLDRVIAMSVYLGHEPITQALALGAGLVVTGRHTDSAMWLAPAAHEFGWPADGWDLMARGIVVGHLMECSGHVTGGNFSFWQEVPHPERLGFPIAEVYENGDAIITKVEGSGGLVSLRTCREQLLYEIHDPANYYTPDVVADFTTLRLEQVGPDRVRVSGASGKRRPDTLKACLAYRDGYFAEGFTFYAWPGALAKARRAAETLAKRYERLGLRFESLRIDLAGVNALHGPLAPEPECELNEVAVRVAAKGPREGDILAAMREIYAMDLSGPAAAAGAFHAGPREMIALWPTRVPRGEIAPGIRVEQV